VLAAGLTLRTFLMSLVLLLPDFFLWEGEICLRCLCTCSCLAHSGRICGTDIDIGVNATGVSFISIRDVNGVDCNFGSYCDLSKQPSYSARRFRCTIVRPVHSIIPVPLCFEKTYYNGIERTLNSIPPMYNPQCHNEWQCLTQVFELY